MRTRSIILAAMLLCGCLHQHPVVPEPARGPALDSLYEVDRGRAHHLSNSSGPRVDPTLALLAPNVAYLRAGAPAVYGIDAARALLAAVAPSADGAAWLPLGGGVSNDLQAGYTYGVTARRPDSLGVPIHFERYIAYWERRRDRPWQITAYTELGGPAATEVALNAAQTTPPQLRLPAPRARTAAAVRAADSLFSDVAYRLGLAVAFSGAVAPTGAVFGSPQLVVGPDAVREYYASQSGGTSLAWHPVYASAAGSGDLGFTIGEYLLTARGPSGAAVQRVGKYLTVWKRQKDGTWKFLIDGGNPTK
ncbi:MAG: YybH family protein [Gemmatimonadales bacterium]